MPPTRGFMHIGRAFCTISLILFVNYVHGFMVRGMSLSMIEKSHSKRIVALTREAGNNDKLRNLLDSKGIDSVEIPCITFSDGPDIDRLPQILATETFDYTVITSPEAAKVFIGGWKLAGKPPLNVACVGTATEAVLKLESGLSVVFVPSKATGEVLAAELPLPLNNTSSSRVLYPASFRAPGTVQSGLESRNFEVLRINTYDTGKAIWSEREKELASLVSVATFGSPSAVKAWIEQCDSSICLAACIGETSAIACVNNGWAKDQVFFPEKPGINGWSKAVEDALHSISS